jgi:hypothetical protein
MLGWKSLGYGERLQARIVLATQALRNLNRPSGREAGK